MPVWTAEAQDGAKGIHSMYVFHLRKGETMVIVSSKIVAQSFLLTANGEDTYNQDQK